VRLLDNGELVMMDTTMNTSYTYAGLDEAVNYSINITATNMAGDSDSVTIQTGTSTSVISIIFQSMYDYTSTIVYLGMLHVHIYV